VLVNAGSIGSLADVSNTSIIEPDSIFLVLKPGSYIIFGTYMLFMTGYYQPRNSSQQTLDNKQSPPATIQYRAATRISFPLARAKTQPARGPLHSDLVFLRGPALLCSSLSIQVQPFLAAFEGAVCVGPGPKNGRSRRDVLGVRACEVMCPRDVCDAQTARLAIITVRYACKA
jgi:hypothetical protein